MTIPQASSYPESFDDDTNLFLVHDSLRVRLLEDYNPGDPSIVVEGDSNIMSKFPPNGIITLTEQCSEPELRAISFFYGSHTDSTFDDLELMPGFIDHAKPRRITNVTMNVFADHHNALKDAIIATEEFIGVKGTVDTSPLGDTLVGRINFLRRLVLTPKAWFRADKRIGIVPVTVTFTDESLRGPTSWKWSFGDGTYNGVSGIISGISASGSISLTPTIEGAVPCGDVPSIDPASKVITKTYYTPGIYDVTLDVANKFGQDSITFENFFVARAPAPDEATIDINPVKVRTNSIVTLSVTSNGEQTDGNGDAIDPVVEYTWKLGDDLMHTNTDDTVAIYSVGGIYDAKLRVDTEFGAYRITTIENAINVVEQRNLWLFAFDSLKSTLATTKNLRTHEFGLISEAFKTNVMPEIAVTRDYSFTSGYLAEDYQRDLFLRNCSFAQKGTTFSGDRGTGILFWAEDESTIRFKQFEPFAEVWSSASLAIGETQTRNWNWIAINTLDSINLLFGTSTIESNPTDVDQSKTKHSLVTGGNSSSSFLPADYLNGANDLISYADNYPATYRTATRGQNGFIARNDAGPGGFFRISSFYRTEGTPGNIVDGIRKLPDIPGTARTELELVSLASGIFVFYNSGEVVAYNPSTNAWSTGGPGIGSATFRSLQDSTVSGYADSSQPLAAASDGDRKAYLSYDYSANAFIKFNEADLTFSSVGSKPTSNEQLMITVF